MEWSQGLFEALVIGLLLSISWDVSKIKKKLRDLGERDERGRERKEFCMSGEDTGLAGPALVSAKEQEDWLLVETVDSIKRRLSIQLGFEEGLIEFYGADAAIDERGVAYAARVEFSVNGREWSSDFEALEPLAREKR